MLHACDWSLQACSFKVLVSLGTRWPAQTDEAVMTIIAEFTCIRVLIASVASVLVSLGTR
jgi:hypothetical protein